MPSIDPFNRKKAPDPKQQAERQPDAAKQTDLLARATGKAKRPVMPTPPPAQMPAGVTGSPPIPTGRLVGHVAPSSLTAIERETLAAAGWSPEVALPGTQEGIKQLRDAVADMESVDVPLPVDPRTPPFRPPAATPISQLPPDKQNALRATLASIGKAEEQKAVDERRRAELMSKETQIKGIQSAGNAADQAIKAFEEKVAAPQPDLSFEVDTSPQPAKPAPQATRHTHSETGADPQLTHCPHCKWDLAIPDDQEPPYADKMAFLHCLMGEKPYSKSVRLFGDAVEVTFRTLTTRELDVIYKQAYHDRQTGKLPNELDYWERINRYRLMLQLQSFKAFGAGGFVHDLPDGYSKSANPTCTGTWVTEEREGEMSPDETGVPTVEQWIVENVLKTEAVFRVVNNACNQFNRLVVKMEAMSDNSDFWKPTGEPS